MAIAEKPTTAAPRATATLTRPDGPYKAGTPVTCDPDAPLTSGSKTVVLVDRGRFAAWERDGFFNPDAAQASQKKEAPDVGEAAQ